MNNRNRLLLGAVVLSAVVATTGQASSVHASSTRAACAALGTYTVLQNGNSYAASAFPAGPVPLVVGGSATISKYTGCGSATFMQINTDGTGALLKQPVSAIMANTLRNSGDLLVHFSGSVIQDTQAPHMTQAVQVSGIATYARVTTKGAMHGKQRLSYSVKTVKISNVRGQLRVVSDHGGAFSLYVALPGPAIGKIPSSLSYFALGAKTPGAFKSVKMPDSNL